VHFMFCVTRVSPFPNPSPLFPFPPPSLYGAPTANVFVMLLVFFFNALFPSLALDFCFQMYVCVVCVAVHTRVKGVSGSAKACSSPRHTNTYLSTPSFRGRHRHPFVDQVVGAFLSSEFRASVPPSVAVGCRVTRTGKERRAGLLRFMP
jgi:hypothetical protein